MQELLWKYAEGNCSPAEKAQVEKQLANDEGLQKELENILEVHSHLMSMESVSPSLRFSQNVMDALPSQYYLNETAPLISPLSLKLFFGILAASFAAVLFIPKAPGSATTSLPYQDNVAQFLDNFVLSLPSVTVQFSVLTIASIMVLIFLDKVLLQKVRGFLMI